jgi:hypothetical protein
MNSREVEAEFHKSRILIRGASYNWRRQRLIGASFDMPVSTWQPRLYENPILQLSGPSRTTMPQMSRLGPARVPELDLAQCIDRAGRCRFYAVPRAPEGCGMLDFIMLAIGLGFFALSVGYTIACDRL